MGSCMKITFPSIYSDFDAIYIYHRSVTSFDAIYICHKSATNLDGIYNYHKSVTNFDAIYMSQIKLNTPGLFQNNDVLC
jgi:hypothetical protein